MKVVLFVTLVFTVVIARASEHQCFNNHNQISSYLNRNGYDNFYEDQSVDLNGDSINEVIFSESGCGYLCDYYVFQKVGNCYTQLKYFRARDYFILQNESGLKEYISPSLIAKYKSQGIISNSCLSYIIAGVYEPPPDSNAPLAAEDIPESEEYEVLCIPPTKTP